MKNEKHLTKQRKAFPWEGKVPSEARRMRSKLKALCRFYERLWL